MTPTQEWIAPQTGFAHMSFFGPWQPVRCTADRGVQDFRLAVDLAQAATFPLVVEYFAATAALGAADVILGKKHTGELQGRGRKILQAYTEVEKAKASSYQAAQSEQVGRPLYPRKWSTRTGGEAGSCEGGNTRNAIWWATRRKMQPLLIKNGCTSVRQVP